MEHALILDAEIFFFSSSKTVATGGLTISFFFSQNPKLDVSVNYWAGLLFLLFILLFVLSFLSTFCHIMRQFLNRDL